MPYDLCLFTRPRSGQGREIADQVMEKLVRSPAFEECEITGGYAEPDEIDVETLEEALEEEELTEGAFKAFCKLSNRLPNVKDPTTAAAFLDDQWGAPLATIELPESAEAFAAVHAAILEFARKEGLRIEDPQTGEDVNLGGSTGR